MSFVPDSILILGIGNLVLADDGVGVHVAQALAGSKLPDRVKVLDVGTAFLDVVSDLEKAGKCIVVDAMQAGGKPGTIYRTSLDQCASPGRFDTLHGLDIGTMFAMAQAKRPAKVLVFGVEPAEISWGMELSPPVAEAVPFVVDEILRELKGILNDSRYS